MYTVQVVPKVLRADSVKIIAKALPETGKPAGFTGAVGRYEIESSIDKNRVEAGDPVTFRVRIKGQGNINTVQTPKLPKMDDFKVYDSSSSANILKERLLVEGEKVTETVIVPRKPGTYEIPPISFTYFAPESASYVTVKSEAHRLEVTGTAPSEPSSSLAGNSASETIFGVEDKEDADLAARDIRYIKVLDNGNHVPEKDIYRQPLYWALNGVLLLLAAAGAFLSRRRTQVSTDAKGSRLRRSHSVARAKLKAAAHLMKQGKNEPFYAELSRAVTGYFADKFNLPVHGVTLERLEELANEHVTAEQMNKIRRLFEEMSMGRFSTAQKGSEDMKDLYEHADDVITAFEKVKLR